MHNLDGKKIVIAGSQKTEELSDIIKKQGGVPVVRSLQGLTYTDEATVDRDIRQLCSDGADWIIFTTGVGLAALCESADRLGMLEKFVDTLQKAKVASRGYRTFSMLKALNVTPEIIADDGSLRSVTGKLDQTELSGLRFWVQLHGQRESELVDFIRERGAADVTLSLPYLYQPPERGTLEQLVEELRRSEVNAVCFTTRAQITYFFDYTREVGCEEEIKRIMDSRVLAVAIGKVTAEGLRREGINRIIVPEVERMGGMIVEIAKFMEHASI